MFGLLRFGTVGLSVFLLSCNNKVPQNQATQSPKNGVLLLDASGDVRVKRAFSANWRSVSSGVVLAEGDQIFTGAGAQARLEYLTAGATMRLGAHSLIVVGARPPGFTRFRRNFGAEQGIKSASKEGKGGQGFARTMAMGKLKETGGALPGGTNMDFSSGLSLIRDVEPIPVIWPVGEIELRAKRFPTPLSITLENRWRGEGLWSFLWKEGGGVSPAWVGFTRESSVSPVVPGPGSYTLQIVTEDESKTTTPIVIEAVLRSSQEQFGLPAVSKKGPTSVVYQ